MDNNKHITQKDAHPSIELHNREMTDLLGDAPVWLIHTGSYLLYGVLFVLLLGAFFISYPDAVKGQAIIEDQANVYWITAHSSGQIDALFVKNDSIVKPGDTIAIMQNPAQLNDVREFCRILANVERYYQTNNAELLREFPFNLIMGEMSTAYETFTQAVKNCLIFDDYNYFPQRKAFLQRELNVLKKEPEKNELAVVKIEREIFELSISHQKEIAEKREQLEVAYEDMVNSLQSWESKYLIRSLTEGKVVLGEEHTFRHRVNQGDTVCSVISDHREEFVARIQLSQEQIAGVETGNTVNINLIKYPAHTYGHLSGEISSISFVPYDQMYVIDIEFEDKLISTARKEIKYELGLKGEAEILTSNRSVLARIFTPIYNLFQTTGNKHHKIDAP